DPLTGTTLYSFAYDAAQRLAAITDVDGNTTQIQRDTQGNVSAIVAPFGQVTQLAAAADGELASVTDPAHQTTAFTYSQGLMASMTDARGGLYQFRYDGAGRLTGDQDPAAGFKQLSRTAGPGSHQVAVTTALGLTTTYAVNQLAGTNEQWITTDPAGVQETSIVGQDGSRTDTTADGFVASLVTGPEPRFLMTAPLPVGGQLTTPSGLSAFFTRSRSVVLGATDDPSSLSTLSDSWSLNGRIYSQTFDRSQMLQTFQTAGGRQFVSTVNATGRPTSLQVGSLDALQLAYDPQGRLATEVQGSGTAQRTVGFSYGADGRLASLTDTLQRKLSFVWDAAGRIVSQTLPDGRMVGFGYDANGNLTAVTPPGRQPHRFAFTPVDQVTSYTPPDLGSGPAATTYSYDLDRRLTGITRPDGKTVLFGYQQGRLSSLNFDGGVIGLAYDPATGLLKTMSAPGGETLGYAYDGPLPTRTSWTGPVAGSVESTFDRNFRVTSQTINGQSPIAFQYDADGLVFAAGDLGIFRDPSTGQPLGTVLGVAFTTQLYNTFGEMSSSSAAYSGTEFFREDFTRDAAGRIARKVETISGASDTYDYTYDAAGRLTDVRRDSAPLSHYDYDANSNRVSAQEGSTTTLATYDAQDRLLSWGDLTYTYNASGDLTSKAQNGNAVTYGFDALGNLATVVDANGVETDYIVDGQNRRVGKRVAGILVQEFLWLDRLKVAAELDGTGNVVSRFVYGTRANVPGMMLRNGVEYLIVTDQLGSPRLVVNSGTGEIAQRLDYDAWGQVTLDSNPGFQPFGFAGGLYDPQTGLVRFGARDYDPAVGRWTVPDPSLFGGGAANLYAYVLSDPVNLTDPNGLDTFDCTINLNSGRNPDLDGHCPLGLCHEYLCVIDEHSNVTCGGLGPAGGGGSGQTGQEWFSRPVPGGNDSRSFNRKHCPLVNRNKCVDKCVKGLLDDHSGRPDYQMFNWYGGRNCWSWAQDVLAACMMRCNPQ
ncbi:MAG TPA: RHS repeat-associated core domain-containing protein, partial [Thermoanaerobaculia bacterium]|nr:RHS repeat-associated core domain-containing protein [Thermoanaerobaculia bacterium]